MEHLKDDTILKFRTDTLEAVRKDVNLEKMGRIEESIDVLEKWVQMQPHFVKKDFPRDYLERTLITSKGLVERAKERLDKLCTFKSLMPEFFDVPDVKKEFAPIQKALSFAHLSELTPEHYRVFITKVISESHLDFSVLSKFYKYLTMLCEYFMRVEYCNGFVIILDYSDLNILNVVTKINPIELRQIITLMTEGYGMRIKAIHVITSSKAVDTMITLLKQVFSAKLASRIHTHRKIETIYDFVPKDILPLDYGGKEKRLKQLHSEWVELISAKEFQDYLSEMNKANTNESCRQVNKFNDHYIGMPGSFRTLSVD